jgi:hypothetical protein
MNIMKHFHGVISLLLIFAAVAISLIYLLTVSVGLGLVYLVIILVSNPIVLYSYCAKCLCREDACSHVLPAKLTRWLPARKQGPYSFGDYFWTAFGLVALLGFPQVWLWQNKALFVLFWIAIVTSLLEIFFLVCPKCKNENCPNSIST